VPYSDNSVDSGEDSTAKIHGVDASRHVLEGLGKDGAGEHGGGGGAISGSLVGLVGDVSHKFGTEVLKLVLELNGLGDGHTVLGDLGATEGLLDDHIATCQEERRKGKRKKEKGKVIEKRKKGKLKTSQENEQNKRERLPLGPRVTETASASLFTPLSISYLPSLPNIMSLA